MDLALSQCLNYSSPGDPKVFESGVRVGAAIYHPDLKVDFVLFGWPPFCKSFLCTRSALG